MLHSYRLQNAHANNKDTHILTSPLPPRPEWAPFSLSGKRLHWTPCPLAYAVFPCVLFCTISQTHAKTYRADLTGGEKKLNSEGTEQNGVIHQCLSLLNRNSNKSQLSHIRLDVWLSKVQELSLHNYMKAPSLQWAPMEIIVTPIAPKCHHFFLPSLHQHSIFSPYIAKENLVY